MALPLFFLIAFQLLLVAGTELARSSSDFVSVKDGLFELNGR
jgi:hypothetical protein